MSRVYRERDPRVRMEGIREALRINPECVPALIMIAEEECTTVTEAEHMLRYFTIFKFIYRNTEKR